MSCLFRVSRKYDTYEKNKGWHRRQVADINEGNGSREVSVSGTDEEQPRRCEDCAVQCSESRACHKERHDPRHNAEQLVAKGLERKFRFNVRLAKVGQHFDHSEKHLRDCIIFSLYQIDCIRSTSLLAIIDCGICDFYRIFLMKSSTRTCKKSCSAHSLPFITQYCYDKFNTRKLHELKLLNFFIFSEISKIYSSRFVLFLYIRICITFS